MRSRSPWWSVYAAGSGRRWRTFARLLVWTIVTATPGLVAGRAVARAVDRGFLAGRTSVGLLWLCPIAVASIVASVGTRRVDPLIGEVVEPLRDRLVRMIVTGNVHRSVRAVGTGTSPDAAAIAQMVGQTEAVRDVTGSLLTSVYHSATMMVAAVIGLASLDPVAAAIVAGPVLATLAMVAVLVPTLAGRTRDLVEADERVAAVAASTAVSVRDIVACGAEGRALAENADAAAADAAASRRMARAVVLRTAAGAIGGNGPVLLLLAIAPWLLRTGRLTVGGVLGALTYLSATLQPALRAAVDTAGVSWVRLSVIVRRLVAQHDGEPVAAPALAGSATRSTGWGLAATTPVGALDLRADRVTFTYGPDAAPIVEGLDLTIRYGEHVAIVGPSGVGKSTLADLLVGLTEPSGGTVRLSGIPLGDLDPARLRSAVALVPQEAYVFAGTLYENLTYLRLDATPAQVRCAAHAVGLLPLVERLGGFHATVNPSRLSHGERQLVVLTRVWLAPARIVVLDEATCHLDPAAEDRAEAAFRQRPGTLVVIAHRIPSAQRAQRVIVMDGGRVRTGTHDELVATNVAYADLVGAWHDGGPGRAVRRRPRAGCTCGADAPTAATPTALDVTLPVAGPLGLMPVGPRS